MTVEIDGFDIDVHPLVYNLLMDYQQELTTARRQRDHLDTLIRQYKVKCETAKDKPTQNTRLSANDAKHMLFAAVRTPVTQLQILDK